MLRLGLGSLNAILFPKMTKKNMLVVDSPLLVQTLAVKCVIKAKIVIVRYRGFFLKPKVSR